MASDFLKNSSAKNNYILLSLIVLFGLLLRIYFFSGMGISDSLAYSRTANDLNLGKGIDPEGTLTLSTRLGIVYPTAFSYNLFGINDFSSTIFVLLTSIAGIILIFYFGKLLFNKKTGLIASFLLSFFPLDVVYSTQLLSDLPSAFFMSLGVYIFLYAEIKRRLKYGLSYLFSGIFIGIGYMIRESALLIALFFISYIVYKRKIKREYFLVPLGVLIIFAIESLLFFPLANDLFFRFHTSQKYLNEASSSHNYFGRLDFPTGLLHYPWLFLASPLLSFFYIPVFIAIIYFLFYKRKRLSKEIWILLLWLIPLLLYLSFGSSSLTDYIPFRAVDRYTSIITLPAILILAFFLSENRFPKKITHLTMIVLLVSSIAAIYSREDRNLLYDLKSTYPFIDNLKKPIYTDERSITALDYISGFDNSLNLKKYPESLASLQDSYILINAGMIKNLRAANPNRQFPPEIDRPLERWSLIKTGKNEIRIYYAP